MESKNLLKFIVTNRNWLTVFLVLITSILLSWNFLWQGWESGMPPVKQDVGDFAASIISKNSKINFPEISRFNNNEVNSDDLSEKLLGLIPDDAKNIEGFRVAYENDKNGMVVRYRINNTAFLDFFESYYNEGRSDGWFFMTAVRANRFAFLDARQENTEARIYISKTNETALQIDIQTIY